jgi:hypothetical protein
VSADEELPWQLQQAYERQEDLADLVRWLAIPYDGAEPVFAGADGLGTPDGRPYERAARLREVWRSVMGESAPSADGVWWRCPTCERWQLIRPERPVTVRRPDGPDSPPGPSA